MKINLKIFIFLIIALNASNQDYSTQKITIGHILATPCLLISIWGEKQCMLWENLISDITQWDGLIPNTIEQYKTKDILLTKVEWVKKIILNGFLIHNGHEATISEQALAAILFFIDSINLKEKIITFKINTKSYQIGNVECWKAICDHIFFAQLIEKRVISCINTNCTPIYHPINFDHNNQNVPNIIKQIARIHGPFFQEDSNLKQYLSEGKNLIDYAHFERDPRISSSQLSQVFLKFPYEKRLIK